MVVRRLSLLFWTVLLLGAAAFASYRWLYNEPFTKEKWNNATPAMRDRLLVSLARTEILVGLTEQEVYDMLGPPDGSSGGQIAYYLADQPDSSRFPAALVLGLTKDDVVRVQNLSGMGESQGSDKFIADIWRNAARDARYAMARDLSASQVLLGLKRQEVIELLGAPDRIYPTDPTITIWYTRRYLQGGEVKKRYAGASRCLYIDIRNGRVAKAEFVGS